jgi:glycosyltransferase involved in cell wall biosynthesis
MKSVRISVLTIFYNRARLVERTLKSLLAQTADDFEVVFVDDGSSDDTLAVARQCANLPGGERLRIYNHENRGFTKSLIEAMPLCRGELIAINGAGDESAPRRLELQAAYLDANPRAGAVGCHRRHVDEVHNAVFMMRPRADFDLGQQEIFMHGEVMFRKSIYDAAGGYRAFFKFAQDRDLWLRMRLICDFGIIPEPLVNVYSFAESVTGNPVKRMHQYYYSDLADQCYAQRRRGEKDIVDRFGDEAWIYRKRSKRLARKLLSIVKSYMILGQWDQAWALLRRSLGEAVTPLGLALLPVVIAGRNRQVGARIAWLLGRRETALVER